MYNCLDGIMAWAPELHHGFTTQSQPWRLGHGLSHLLGNSRTCGGRRLPPGASPSCRRLSDEWMDWSSHLGFPRGCSYALGEAWGHAPTCLARDLPWGRRNLVSINSASSRFLWFAALPCGRHISHVRTPNNANLVSRLCVTKLSPTLVFIGLLGNEDKIPKTASEDNLSDFGLVCTAGISGAISPSSLTRIGPSTCPNRRYCRGLQLW
jgi:hypothetical protein